MGIKGTHERKTGLPPDIQWVVRKYKQKAPKLQINTGKMSILKFTETALLVNFENGGKMSFIEHEFDNQQNHNWFFRKEKSSCIILIHSIIL